MFCGTCGMQNLDTAATCVRCSRSLGVVGGVASGVAAGMKPESYLVPAVISTLCCCMPFGIVSIVFASQVNSKWNAGDILGTRDAAAKAKLWFWLAFGIGLPLNLITIALQVAATVAESQQR